MNINMELRTFLDKSPTSFHAVENIKAMLRRNGYEQLEEGKTWTLRAGNGYFVTRNESAIIAFYIPDTECKGFQIIASHCDSPALKIKANPEIEIENQYVKLNIEKYGGIICSTWFDRPLSVAGRLIINTECGIKSVLVNVDRDLLVIPNLAIHMDRSANDGKKISVQKEMSPLFSQIGNKSVKLLQIISEYAGVKKMDILDADLFVYNRMKSTIYGANEEFIAGARLDDLQCVFASVTGILQADIRERIAICCVYDNEEVGSGSRQGAASTFLKDVIVRIHEIFSLNEQQRQCSIYNSFMLSADNAHSLHPNYSEKSDIVNKPYVNKGIVIKYSANQKYTTDGISGALCKQFCQNADVPYQIFYNNSDVLGGSTLGNISSAQIPFCSADIGLAQLAMHSAYETAGAFDTEYMVRLSKEFFSSGILHDGDEIKII